MVLTDRFRIVCAIAITGFSTGVIAVTLYSWHQSEQLRVVHETYAKQISSLKRSHASDNKRHQEQIELLKKIEFRIVEKCEK